MKTLMKILMLLLLCLFVYLSLSHLLNIEKPTIGAYWLTIFTIFIFFIYVLVSFLDLEVLSKWVSIKRKMNTLENKQKQLSKIATTLYKLLIFFKYHIFYPAEVDKNFEIFERLQNEIEQYIDNSDIKRLKKELDESHKKFRGYK